MSHWKNAIKRSNSNEIRKEDDRTLCIKDFFERQNQDNYTIEKTDKEFFVDVEGDVHIHPEDIGGDGTLGFKLRKVAGNLVCHTSSISKNVIPDELGGSIVFELENKDDKSEEAAPAQKEETAPAQNQEPGQFGACDDCPYKKGAQADDGFGGMEMLQKNPPSKQKVKLALESLISDCLEYGYDIDFDAIRKTIEEQKNNSKNYNLRINIEFTKGSKRRAMKNKEIERLDIYISDNDDDLLNLSAIEKATYLTFLFYNDGNGIVIEDMKKDFIELMSSIYKRLPGREIKFNDENNITYGNLTLNTLAGYRNAIRNAIKEKLRYNGLVNEFAIEGYKNLEFKISKSTEEIRNLIREVFLIQ